MVTLYFAEGVLTGMTGTVLLSYRREAETLSCRTGLLRLFTPQTETCLRGPRSRGHFVACIPVWAGWLSLALPLVGNDRADRPSLSAHRSSSIEVWNGLIFW